MYPGEKKLNSVISSSKGDSKVLLFAEPLAGSKYTYLGKLSYITMDEKPVKPTIVTWKGNPWTIPTEMRARFWIN